MDSNLSMTTLAQLMNTNVSYLSQAINKITHQNFKSFINQYRVKEAIKQIINANGSVKLLDTIADTCGFSDRSTFYRSFKKETGLSPSQFKQNMK